LEHAVAPAVIEVQRRLKRRLKRPSLLQGAPKVKHDAGLLVRRNTAAWNRVDEPRMESGLTSSVNMLKRDDNSINFTQGMFQNTAAGFNPQQDGAASNSPQGPLHNGASSKDPQDLQSPGKQQGEQLQQKHENQQGLSHQLQHLNMQLREKQLDTNMQLREKQLDTNMQLRERQLEQRSKSAQDWHKAAMLVKERLAVDISPSASQRGSPRLPSERWVQKPLRREGQERSDEEGLPNFWASESHCLPDSERWQSPSVQSQSQVDRQSPRLMLEVLGTVDLHKAALLSEERLRGGSSASMLSQKTTINNLRNAKVQADENKVQDKAERKSAKLTARVTKLRAENAHLDTQILECERRIQNLRSGEGIAAVKLVGAAPMNSMGDIKRKIHFHSKALQKLTEKCMAMQVFLSIAKKQSAEVHQSDDLPFGEDWNFVQQPLLRQGPSKRVPPVLALRVQSRKLHGTASRSTVSR